MKKKILFSIMVLTLLIPLFPLATSAAPTTTQEEVQLSEISPKLIDQMLTAENIPLNVLIETNTKDYESVTSQIKALGGEVTHEFKYATGLAVEIPANKIAKLVTNPDIIKISLDELRYPATSTPELNVNNMDSLLRSEEAIELNAEDVNVVSLNKEQIETLLPLIYPETYWNYISMGAIDVWSEGYRGNDSLCVIIDTGVFADHYMLGRAQDGPVIGGVDLSYDNTTINPNADPIYEGFDNWLNHWHGTHVAGIFAGAGGILVTPDELLYQSFELHAFTPLDAETLGYPGLYLIPLFGMAPFAEVFGIKVFDHTGGAVPESMVLNAIEYAIDMHESGDYDVDIISMSLGGGTGYDGRDFESQIVDYATSIGITVVSSAGNEGPASMTVGSPGTAHTAIAVAAAANPVNTRIFWDMNYEMLGIGNYLYTSDTPQIYAFSSRGPTSDGRLKPEVSATGMFVVSCITPPLEDPEDRSWVGWASGTSMACPAVAGAVALLNTWAEWNEVSASPYDYKQAIMNGAEWLEGYDVFDQGAGYLNAWNSLVSLANDQNVDEKHPPIPPIPHHAPVKPNGINTHIYGSGIFVYRIRNLEPGHSVEFYFKATELTNKIEVKIPYVRLGDDLLGLDSFELYIQSAVRTGYDYFIDSANVWGNSKFIIEDYSTTWSGDTSVDPELYQETIIQPGYMRVVVENDWTSSDSISGLIIIKVKQAFPHHCWLSKFFPRLFPAMPTPDEEYVGTISSTDEAIGWIPVGFGTSGVIVELWWENDWTHYPTTDLDMVIAYVDNEDVHYEFVAGGSLRSPEGVYIENSNLTGVYVLLFGYQTYSITENWNLRVYYV